MSDLILDFVRESNRIEGITRDPTTQEVVATESFVALESLTVNRVKALVQVYQPNARLRDRFGLNVRVGNHVPPPGGDGIHDALRLLLLDINDGLVDLYIAHQRYETLHPFTDGNGRSGRAIWLWQWFRDTKRLPKLGFLHNWYYQSLSAWRP